MGAFLGNEKFSLGAEASDTLTGACVSARVLPLLGVQPALGRNFVAADERPGAPPVVMVSHALTTLGSAIVGVLALLVIAVWWPARRAAGTDPQRALRHE
jgi:ABC-type antimicrobial peptide transport system permease subunit